MAELQFDASNVEPQQNLEPIPSDWYNLMITDSDKVATTNGSMLKLTLMVIDGQYANRKVFDNLNIENTNPVAEEISLKRLSAYCHATGVIRFQNTSQLHGIPFKGKVGIKIDKSGVYDPANKINGIKALGEGGNIGGAPQVQPPVPPQYPQPQQVQPQPQPQPQYQQPQQVQPVQPTEGGPLPPWA